MQDNSSNSSIAFIFGAAAAVLLAIFYFIGWVGAHSIVAHECNKLGSFYVGNVVYECKRKQVDK